MLIDCAALAARWRDAPPEAVAGNALRAFGARLATGDAHAASPRRAPTRDGAARAWRARAWRDGAGRRPGRWRCRSTCATRSRRRRASAQRRAQRPHERAEDARSASSAKPRRARTSALAPSARSPARCRPMTLASLDGVVALETEVYPFPWTRGNFVDSLAAGYIAWTLNGSDGELLGYCVAMRGVDEMHLLNITVAPAARRRGHARRLLDALVATVPRRATPSVSGSRCAIEQRRRAARPIGGSASPRSACARATTRRRPARARTRSS